MMELSAPRDAPRLSSRATSATYVLVATVETDMASPNSTATTPTAMDPVDQRQHRNECREEKDPEEDLDPAVHAVGKPPEERLGERNGQDLDGEHEPDLVGRNALAREVDREIRLDHAVAEVGGHLHEGRAQEPPVMDKLRQAPAEIRHRHFLHLPAVRGGVCARVVALQDQGQDEHRHAQHKGRAVDGAEVQERDDGAAQQRGEGAPDKRGGRISPSFSPLVSGYALTITAEATGPRMAVEMPWKNLMGINQNALCTRR